MKRLLSCVFVLSTAFLIIGCGEKLREMKKATDALEQLSKTADKMKESTDEASKFYEERKAKGDTVPMDYKALQEYLPKEISGYTLKGGPGGNSTSMTGFAMTTADQEYVSGADSNNPQRIKVSLIDYGGTEGAYGLASLALNFTMNSEDDHHRAGTKKFDIPYTAGIEEYNKDSHDAKVSVGTRYRYFISVEASNQKDDQSAMVASIAGDIAKKFDGK